MRVLYLLLIAMSIMAFAFCEKTQFHKLTTVDTIWGVKQFDVGERLQTLIDDTPSGDTLFLPEAYYPIDTPVRITKPITIFGTQSCYLQFTNQHDWKEFYGTTVGMLNIMADSVTIYGITVDQNYRNSGRGNGDTALIGSIIGGGVAFGAPVHTHHTLIRKNLVYDIWGNGVAMFASISDDIIIDSNTTTSFGNITETDTVFGPLGHGEQQISIAEGTGITINNNKILGTADDAIAVHTRATDVEIKKNYIISNGGRGRILVSGAHNCLIDSNTISLGREDGATGIWLTLQTGTPFYFGNQNLTVSNNVIQAKQGTIIGYGVRMYGAGDSIYILNNRIIGSGDGFQSFGINVRSRTWHKNGDFNDSLSISGSNMFLTNNYISNVTTTIFVGSAIPSDSITITVPPNPANLAP